MTRKIKHKGKIIGIAKRDLKDGEEIALKIDKNGEILPNESINFLEGTNIGDYIK